MMSPIRLKSRLASLCVLEAIFDQIPSKSIKTELADDGRPAPAALPGDCCGLPSPTRSPDGSKRPETDHVRVFFAPKILGRHGLNLMGCRNTVVVGPWDRHTHHFRPPPPSLTNIFWPADPYSISYAAIRVNKKTTE